MSDELEDAIDRALALGDEGRHREVLELLEDALRGTTGIDWEAAEAEPLARAGLLAANAAADLDRHASAIALYDAVLRGRPVSPDPVAADTLVRTLISKGATLAQMGELDGCVAVFDEAIALLRRVEEPNRSRLTARAVFGRAHWLVEAGHREEAQVGYRRVIDEFGEDPRDDVKEYVAAARSRAN